MRAVAYIRVSTKEQDENVQRKAIKEFSKTRNIEIFEWYVDKGESGSKPFRERPEALRLLNELELLKPEAIIVYAIDRVGRSMLDTVQTLLELESKNIAVISVKEEWLQSLDSNIRKLILSILSWVAEFERKRIRERQLSAWEAGKQKGRPRKVKDSTIEHYLKRYGKAGLSLHAIWKIMKSSGYDISYETFRRHARRLGYKQVLTISN